MQSLPSRIHVLMPDDSMAEITFYCTDVRLSQEQKKDFTQLYIQLHDCLCIQTIRRSISTEIGELERLIHNKVISAKSHLY